MVTVDSRSLNKVLQICQKSSAKLDQMMKKQDKLETTINEQKDKISEILSKLERAEQNDNSNDGNKGKDKGKGKGREFYQVSICLLLLIYY